MTAVGHALLRSIANGQGEMLRSAADALGRLERMLPNPSAEARMIAVLMSLTADPTSQAETTVQTPPPARARRKARDKASQPAKASRKPKASRPLIDVNGKIHPSREVNGIAVISQAEARKALGMSCIQMLRLEDQKLLSRIQESGSRLVYYSVAEVQKLLDLIHRDADPQPDADADAVTDGVA